VVAEDASTVRRLAGLSPNEPLFADAACTQRVDDRNLPRGVYVTKQAPSASPPPQQDDECFDPYPERALRNKKRGPLQKRKRVATLRDVADALHEIKAPEEAVVAEARVVRETFARVSEREFSLVFGSRSRGRGRRPKKSEEDDKQKVLCEAFGGEAELEIAETLGLEQVGCATVCKDAKPGAAALVAAARSQLEAMRRLGRQRTFPFVLLVASEDGSALEAFEVSEQLVQLVAENKIQEEPDVVESDDASSIHTAGGPVLVEGLRRYSFDPEWVYRPVPIIGCDGDFFSAGFHDDDVDGYLRRRVLGNKKKPKDLVAAFTDLRVLVRLKGLLTPRDFTTLCDVLRKRRADGGVVLPRSFAAALLQILASKLDPVAS